MQTSTWLLQNWSCSGKLPLFQADPREVIVPAPDLRMVGFDGLPVILALGFLVLAVHAEDVLIIHAHDPAAIQRLPAPIAVLNFKKSVSHISSFKRFYPASSDHLMRPLCHVPFWHPEPLVPAQLLSYRQLRSLRCVRPFLWQSGTPAHPNMTRAKSRPAPGQPRFPKISIIINNKNSNIKYLWSALRICL